MDLHKIRERRSLNRLTLSKTSIKLLLNYRIKVYPESEEDIAKNFTKNGKCTASFLTIEDDTAESLTQIQESARAIFSELERRHS